MVLWDFCNWSIIIVTFLKNHILEPIASYKSLVMLFAFFLFTASCDLHLVQQSHMAPKTLKILVYRAFNAINQMDPRPQLSCKHCTPPTNKHSCSSDSRVDFMMFWNQVRPITLCGSDVTVHVMPAFGLYRKEEVFLSECGSSTPICVSSLFF